MAIIIGFTLLIKATSHKDFVLHLILNKSIKW
nr:MAG TPA: hypothetical protein [Caudoviricetes sp.]